VFWSLMVFLALALAKMRAVEDFVRVGGLVNYLPLALVAVLFLFVWIVDQRRKPRERTTS
jgi:hypothetical protein